MASEADAAPDHRGNGSRLHQASSHLGHGPSPMDAASQSCCVADRRFPYYGKTNIIRVQFAHSVCKYRRPSRVGGTPTSACTGLLEGGDWRPQAGIACRRPTGTAHRQDDNPRVSRAGLRSDQTGRLNSAPCKFRGPHSQQHFSASGFLLHRHRYCVIKR